MVEAFEPAVGFFVVEYLVFRPAGFSLFLPSVKELRFVEDQARIRAPFPQGFVAGAIHHRQAAQLAELLRELWDFR